MIKPVLLIIDMVNDFFKEGHLAQVREELTTAINELVEFAREREFPVIWVTQEFSPDLADAPLYNKDIRELYYKDRQYDIKKEDFLYTIRGTEGCQLLSELSKKPTDDVVIKNRYSAFWGTSLEQTLKDYESNHILIAGINTHACVRTTAVDAYQRNYRVILATDCISSYDLEHHNISLKYMSNRIGKSLTNIEIEEYCTRDLFKE